MNVLGPDLFLVIAAAAMVAGGIYLVLERSLTRIAVGLVLIGNGINILFIIIKKDIIISIIFKLLKVVVLSKVIIILKI